MHLISVSNVTIEKINSISAANGGMGDDYDQGTIRQLNNRIRGHDVPCCKNPAAK